MRENEEAMTDWSEQDSQTFIDFGRYFVPERELQFRILCELVAPTEGGPFEVLELCCGEGLLAGALLERYPDCRVRGLDGSPEMLDRAGQRLAAYGERFRAEPFDLFSRKWREPGNRVDAVLSSLAVHHLDGAQKQELFRDVYRMLVPGGGFFLSDLIQPADEPGRRLAALLWDDEVRQRSLAIEGSREPFDFFQRTGWNIFSYPDPVDKPSSIFEQLKWLEAAGFVGVDLFWMKAGHAIYGGRKP